ncbi:MAG: GTP-dependent dephospho-CoA kinase family protein [Methanomicrobium sp.]|nr:GTP-dependent dephospho-CoA kinase family protein [Methanomicrobium sp.]
MWYLPEKDRVRFKAPFGVLFPDIESALLYAGDRRLYAVGDVVTSNIVRKGIIPSICVIDGSTMRVPFRDAHLSTQALSVKRYEVSNPAGYITDELIDALRSAIEFSADSQPALVHVNGEEDLAVIPLVRMLPLESAVFYGQPGEGVVVKIIDDAAKEQANELFSYFERRDGAGSA